MSEASAVASATAAPVPEDRAGRARFRPPARSNGAYWTVLYVAAGIFVVLCVALIYSTVTNSIPAWQHSGFGLLFGTTWDPDNSQYGALPLIIGTLETSFLALLFAVPIGVLVAVSIVFLVPRSLRSPLSSFVELLAAIPSIVYGIIGLVILGAWMQNTVVPWLQSVTHDFVLFGGVTSGKCILTAGMVLFIMVLPTVVALSRDALATVAHEQIEGAMSIGATRWQTISRVVIPGARLGITGAVTLAAARALGETIAVAMVVGGAFHSSLSLVQGGNTLAATIATSWDDATLLTKQSLFALGVILIVITAVLNYAGRAMFNRAQRGATL